MAVTTPASSCPGIVGVRSRSWRSVQVEGQLSSVPTNPDPWISTSTSLIAGLGSGRSLSFIPAVPAAWSVTTIAFIVVSSSLLAIKKRETASAFCYATPDAPSHYPQGPAPVPRRRAAARLAPRRGDAGRRRRARGIARAALQIFRSVREIAAASARRRGARHPPHLRCDLPARPAGDRALLLVGVVPPDQPGQAAGAGQCRVDGAVRFA